MTASTTYFKHETAIVESPSIGAGTRVWAFAHILPGAVIGSECNLCDHTFIENDVRIGDRVTIKCGVQIWDGVWLEDDVFVGPNVTFSNDSHPRSRQRPAAFERTLVKRGASIGANATILPGTTIGERAMIGAGAVVTRDAPPRWQLSRAIRPGLWDTKEPAFRTAGRPARRQAVRARWRPGCGASRSTGSRRSSTFEAA